MVNDHTIYDKIGRASNDRAFRSLYSREFSRCGVDLSCKVNVHEVRLALQYSGCRI